MTPVQHLIPAEKVTPYGNITVGLCSPGVNYDLTPLQSLLVEFLASLILVFVCCGVWDQRNKDKHDSVPVRFGLAIAVLAMAAVRMFILQYFYVVFQVNIIIYRALTLEQI